MKHPLVIYHGNCADGFGAAWAVRKYYEKFLHAGMDMPDFYPGVYQDPPPDVRDRLVILVDFSYKRPVLEQMAKSAHGILILDHHASAADDLKGFSSAGDTVLDLELCAEGDIRALFDLERSGAGIAWDYFHPHDPRPPLIDVIEDRDLWRFDLPNTREIQAALFSYPYVFEVWDELMQLPLKTLVQDGTAIERKHHKDIAELLAVMTRTMNIAGHVVPVANLPYTLTSDAGHALSAEHPFGACYWDTPEGRVFSLRSREDGHDVSEIAKRYGGGGHRNAAGFRVPFDQLEQFECG